MCKFSTDGPYLVVLDEDHSKVLLQSKIRTHDVYERQGSNVPYSLTCYYLSPNIHR